MYEIIGDTFPYTLIIFVGFIAMYFVFDRIESEQERKIQKIALKNAERRGYEKGFQRGEETAWMKKYYR